MADRWAVATGNWSSTATWNGGTLPTASDDVFADGFTVTIDQNVTVLSIRTTQRTGGTAGGGFTCSTPGLTLNFTGTGVLAGTTVCLAVSANTTINAAITGSSTNQNQHGLSISAGTVNLVGNVSSGTGVNGNVTTQGHGITMSGLAVLNMTGSVTGTQGNNATGISASSGTTITVIGNVTGPNMDNNQAFGINSAGIVTVTGNVTGGGSSGGGGMAHGVYITGTGIATINGTCSGGTGGTSSTNAASGTNVQGPHGLQNAGTGNCIINGNCLGGVNGRSFGASNQSSGSITVNGNVTAGGNTLAFGIVNFGTGTVTVNGSAYGSANGCAFFGFGTGLCILRDNAFSGSAGGTGFSAIRGLIHPANILTFEYRVNSSGNPGVARSLYTGGQNLGQPTAANVRAGSTFGVSNEFTGTLVVPSAQFVALGTPVDSGVGTLQYLTMSDLQSALQSNAPTVNERTLSDTNSLSFSWPVSGVITGQVSKNNGAYANVQGAISYLRFEGNRHYYSLAYNAADRPTQEGVARYKFTDGTYTRYANLRVYPAPNNTAIESINSRLPANPASAQQITSLQNNAPTEIF